MNEKIRKHLEEFCKKNNWGMEDGWIFETLQECGKEIYRKDLGGRRWWKDLFIVKEIDGMLIGFDSATTTGDESPWEKGWEFDEESICEVVKKEETKIVTTYERISPTA